MHTLCLVIFASAVGISADDPPPQSDQEKAQGTWVVEKVEVGKLEEPLKNYMQQLTQLDIKGDTCVMFTRDSGTDPEERHKLTLTLDGKQTPGHMDFATDGKKSPLKAIYRFDEDALAIAVGLRDDYRPKGFDPNKEAIFVLVLKKKKL